MVTKYMTILDIVDKFPETIDLFQAYDKKYSTCICCTSLFETLEKTALKHDLDLSELLAELNKVLKSKK